MNKEQTELKDSFTRQFDKYGEFYRQGDYVSFNDGYEVGIMKSIDLENDTMVISQYPHGRKCFRVIKMSGIQRNTLNNGLTERMRIAAKEIKDDILIQWRAGEIAIGGKWSIWGGQKDSNPAVLN